MRARLLASVLVAAVVSSSCSSEETPRPASSGFGTGGQSGSGGTAGASGGSAGTTGLGGSAHEAGVGGNAQEAGVGGSAGTGTGGGGGSLADGAACQLDPPVSATNGSCVELHSPGYDCNPVTSEGCEAGQVCEFFNDRFACFPATTTQPACGECYAQGQSYCGPGFTCFGGTNICTRFCCDDSDCAAGSACVPQPPTTVGICQADDGTRFAAFAFAADAGQVEAGSDAGQDASDDDAASDDSGDDANDSGEGGDAAVEGWIACVANTPAVSAGSCYSGPGCNPISQAGCNQATEACEWVGDSFTCVTRFDSLDSCELCKGFGLCAAGYTCDPSSICARLCCDNSDCDAESYCEPYDQASLGPIGLCKRNQ